MDEKERMAKKQERERTISILVHSIADQAAAVENITYKGAIGILDRAKYILERQMEYERATVPQEVRDKWGNIVEMPDTHGTGQTEAEGISEINGITVDLTKSKEKNENFLATPVRTEFTYDEIIRPWKKISRLNIVLGISITGNIICIATSIIRLLS